uniref:YEATS domain-containing protein n=1 Tax=Ditylum brightwellii TaxID=49249 RepID=A0A7S1Z287_9STRA
MDTFSRNDQPNNSGAAGALKTGVGASPRLLNTTVCVPIVYGSIAFFLGKKADEYHTHRWTLYVRSPNGEDLSTGISKVVFQLHPSFPQPVRELTAPPFEVTEKGWGEFEATIRIVWRDPGEKATVLTHGIKLYPPGLTQITPATTSKEPVVHEFYDEVVFTDPTEAFHRQLMRSSVLPRIQSHEPTVQENFPTYADEEDFKALLAAQKFLEDELRDVKDRIMKADMAREEIEEALRVAATAKASSSQSGGKSGSSSGKGGGSGGKTKSSGGGGTASKKSKASH